MNAKHMQWKVKTISGSSGGVEDVAEVNLRIVAPGMSVDGVARMCESAPELLEALIRCVEKMTGEENGITYKQEAIDSAVNSARAAIQKARGA